MEYLKIGRNLLVFQLKKSHSLVVFGLWFLCLAANVCLNHSQFIMLNGFLLKKAAKLLTHGIAKHL